MIALAIEAESGGWDAAGDIEALSRRAAEAALAALGLPPEEVAANLLLTDDAAVREMNRRWRGQDRATNVLSFPHPFPSPRPPGSPRLLGDIALAYETVAREAAQDGKPIGHHASHLVIHGLLHLLGQDHGDDAEAEAMEAIERQALASLGIPDPYRDGV